MPQQPLRAVAALARRELGFYFNSPIAYVVLTAFFLACGVWLFAMDNPDTGRSFFEENETSLRRLFEAVPLFFVFLVPAISMRLISEEKRTGTIELLVSWPVSDGQIVIGKYLGGLAFVAIALLGTLPLAFIVGGLGNLDAGAVVGGYVGLLLVGAAYLALGLMTSAWTSNQIIAYLVGAFICGFFYFIDGLGGAVAAGADSALAGLSFKAHFQNVSRGVLDLRDLVFYGSFIAIALVTAAQSLGARAWKQ
jgi:ABC-2 type transport system permease protein